MKCPSKTINPWNQSTHAGSFRARTSQGGKVIQLLPQSSEEAAAVPGEPEGLLSPPISSGFAASPLLPSSRFSVDMIRSMKSDTYFKEEMRERAHTSSSRGEKEHRVAEEHHPPQAPSLAFPPLRFLPRR